MKYGISLGNSKLGRLAIGSLSDKGVAEVHEHLYT
jgi:hypothetical protein